MDVAAFARKVIENVEQVVVGKRDQIRLALVALLLAAWHWQSFRCPRCERGFFNRRFLRHSLGVVDSHLGHL